MISISVQSEFDQLARFLTDVQKRQLPFATALALTDVAKGTQTDLQAEMAKVFDRPVPYTLRGVYAMPATKARPTAGVFFRDFAGKGVPAGRYLKPQIQGGGRAMKSTERKVNKLYGLGGLYLVPGRSMPKDAYGNPNPGLRNAIMSQIGAYAPKEGSTRKRKTKHGDKRFVLVRPGSNEAANRGNRVSLKPGIYQVFGAGLHERVKPMYLISKQPQYQKRFDFFGVANRSMRDRARPAFHKALARAFATAKRR